MVTELPDDMQYVNNLVNSLFVSSMNWSAIKFVLSDVHIHPFADAESFIHRISKSASKIITSDDSWFIRDVWSSSDWTLRKIDPLSRSR